MRKSPIVAIIDSGFTPFSEETINVLWGCSYQIVDGEICVDSTYDDGLGHGTQCVYVINKYCKDASYIIIKVIDDQGFGYSLLIYEALRRLCDVDVDVINVSLSIQCSDYEDEISAVLKELFHQGKIVNVAVANRSNSSFPACNPYCVGIRRKDDMNDEKWIQYDHESDIQISVNTFPEFLPTIDNRFEWFSGNSKSTAMVSGLMLKYLATNPRAEVQAILENVCLNENPVKQSDAGKEIQNLRDMALFIKCYHIFVKHFHRPVLPTTKFVTEREVAISSSYEMLLEIQNRTRIPICFSMLSYADMMNLGMLIHNLNRTKKDTK